MAVEIVGPIEPRSDKKSRYILTMIDYATRYPEAVALPSIETERVAEALIAMFSRVGIPSEMLIEQESRVTIEVMNGWLVVLRLNVPVNNFSVMSGRSHRFLGN